MNRENFYILGISTGTFGKYMEGYSVHAPVHSCIDMSIGTLIYLSVCQSMCLWIYSDIMGGIHMSVGHQGVCKYL